ncbi:MAG: isoaspartyl peptidase/L-asparaginase [Candidatus Omnitrophica bacterium]|nr:isoaspartyl peptidase/L-asparaginase [Candidatus Omnitrophota bacterium]
MISKPVLIIHGGAGDGFKDRRRAERVRKKLARILKLSYQTLLHKNALEAVTHAVKLMEDAPDFNAGRGSQLQADGHARLSASIMEGYKEHFAAVINLEKIRNPILVAKALLKQKSRVLAGEGAFRFAKKLGMKTVDTRTALALKRWKEKKKKGFDTVGACALDRFGHLASATSTGGRGNEFPGRVSDSGMPVANYATPQCAIAATGIGEEIMEEGLAVKIAVRYADGHSLEKTFKKTFGEIRSKKRNMGAIGLDREGKIAADFTSKSMMHGWKKGKTIRVEFKKRSFS